MNNGKGKHGTRLLDGNMVVEIVCRGSKGQVSHAQYPGRRKGAGGWGGVAGETGEGKLVSLHPPPAHPVENVLVFMNKHIFVTSTAALVTTRETSKAERIG